MSSVSSASRVALAVVDGELDAVWLLRRMTQSVDAGLERVVIDLGEVAGLSPQSISALCCGLRGVSRHGATLTIVGASPRLGRVIELCEIGGVTLQGSVDAAMAPASRVVAR